MSFPNAHPLRPQLWGNLTSTPSPRLSLRVVRREALILPALRAALFLCKPHPFAKAPTSNYWARDQERLHLLNSDRSDKRMN